MTWGYFIQSHLEFKKGFFKNNTLTRIISFFITKFPLLQHVSLGDVGAQEGVLWPISSTGQSITMISVQSLSHVRLCDTMNHSTPGLPVHHQLPEFTETHVHRVGDAIQPSHPLSSPSPTAPNPSQHQSFPMSQLFASGGQSTGASALASFLPKNTQD